MLTLAITFKQLGRAEQLPNRSASESSAVVVIGKAIGTHPRKRRMFLYSGLNSDKSEWLRPQPPIVCTPGHRPRKLSSLWDGHSSCSSGHEPTKGGLAQMATDTQIPDLRTVVRANIDANSKCDAAYVTMNVLATVIACYGLLENSPAVVIGAMLIAMLLGPISGIALGLVDRDNSLVRKAFLSLACGIGVVYGTAFVFGLAHGMFPLTSEIYARTAPNLMDLMIALSGGAAGAYAIASPRLNVAFVGVAIATALVPPLSSSAICLARGDYRLSAGAFLLAFANMVGIQVASSIVLWLSGYRGQTEVLGAGRLFRRSFVSLGILAALTAMLSVSLRRMLANEIYEASVRTALKTASTTQQGAYLADVRFRREAGRAIVTAVYRTPVPFAPNQVGLIERILPRTRDDVSLELRIRSVPVTVASKDGYLYSSSDLVDALTDR